MIISLTISITYCVGTNLSMKLILSAIIACLVTDKIRITYGDQICHPEFASECPNSSTCCSKVKCDAEAGKFRCCEDYERKDESLKTFCSVCPTCGNNTSLCFQTYARFILTFYNTTMHINSNNSSR